MTNPEGPTDSGDAAANHLEAEIQERRGSWMRRFRRWLRPERGMDLDLVIFRLSTGDEVIRADAGTLGQADRLLQRVRRELRMKTVREFMSDWTFRG